MNTLALAREYLAALENGEAGSEMHAHFAVFLDFRDGKIARQRSCDCFDLL